MLVLPRYADLHHASSDVAWTRAFFVHAEKLGFDCCLFATIPSLKAPLSSVWVRSSFPAEWLERYFSRGYVAADFKVTRCMERLQPFLWEPSAFAGREQRRIYDEGCEFGLRAGISLPSVGTGGCYGQLCLSRNVEPDRRFRAFVEERLAEILVLRDTLMHTCRRFAFPTTGEHEEGLTVRELQCLRIAAAGKTSRRIAEDLGCAEATVNFHLSNARRKLRVPTRQAAIAKAIQTGRIIL